MDRKFNNTEECYEHAIRQNKLIIEGKIIPKRYTIDEFKSHLIEVIRKKYEEKTII